MSFKISRASETKHCNGNLFTQIDELSLAQRDNYPENVIFYGAKGDGVTDDTVAIQAALRYGASTGTEIYFPAGNYLINSYTEQQTTSYGIVPAAVLVETDGCIVINMDPEAVITLGTGLNDPVGVSTRATAAFYFFNISGVNTPGECIIWKGGKIDGSLLTQEPVAGTSMVRAAQKFDRVSFDGVVFDHGVRTASGADNGIGGGDESLLVSEPNFFLASQCTFLGAPDAGIYLSGGASGLPRIGQQAIISDCYFYRCSNALAMKRFFKRTIVSNNHMLENVIGVLMGGADGVENQGTEVSVVGNFITKTQAFPTRFENTQNVVVVANQIIDWGRWVSNGTTPTTIALGNIPGGVKIDGSARHTVCGNNIGYDEWTARSNLEQPQSVGVALGTYAPTATGTTGGIVTGNTISACYQAYYISNESSDNSIGSNKLVSNTTLSILGTNTNYLDVNLWGDEGTGLKFLGSRTFQANGSSLEITRFAGVANAVNSIGITNGATGTAPLINARGGDADVDLSLAPRGANGRIRFGTLTASADVPVTGYIEIKDSAGTVRRLAVV